MTFEKKKKFDVRERECSLTAHWLHRQIEHLSHFCPAQYIHTAQDALCVTMPRAECSDCLIKGTCYYRTTNNDIPFELADHVFKHMVQKRRPCGVKDLHGWELIIDHFEDVMAIVISNDTCVDTIKEILRNKECKQIYFDCTSKIWLGYLCDHVEYIRLSYKIKSTNKSITTMAQKLPNLKTLDIRDARNLNYKAMITIAKNFPKLEHLYLKNCSLIDDFAIEMLMGAQSPLKTVCLERCTNVSKQTFTRIVLNFNLLCAYYINHVKKYFRKKTVTPPS